MNDDKDSSGHFSIAEAITQPFRLPGGLGFYVRILFWASLMMGLLFLIFGKALFTSYLEFFRLALELETSENPEDFTQMFRVMFGMIIPVIFLSIGSWAVMVSAETAMHKNIFYGTDNVLFPLRFAKPELYVTLAQLVVYGIVIGVYFTGYMAFIFISILVILLAQLAEAFAIIGGLLMFFTFLGLMLAMLIAFMRFAPAAALSVRDDDIRLLEGWNATKGRFWSLLGSYCIVGILGYIVILAASAVILLIAIGDGAILSMFEGVESDDPDAYFQALIEMFDTAKFKIGFAVSAVILTILNFVWKSSIWGIANYAARKGPAL